MNSDCDLGILINGIQAKSRIQCISSAHNILNHLKSDDEQSAILLKWWIVLFYGFAAAVVLFIDLCHMKASEGIQEDVLEERREQLRQALDLFKTAEHISVVSRNAIVLLEGLLSTHPYDSIIDLQTNHEFSRRTRTPR